MIFDREGAIQGEHYIEYGLIFTPQGVEQDAHLWWAHAKAALLGALRTSGAEGREVAALGVSSQGIAFVPVDGAGQPLANAISWYDQRAAAEAEEIAACYGEAWLFQTTGRRPGSFLFPQVLHMKRHAPDLYAKARWFLMGHDYLTYRLCGRAVTDYTLACGTLSFDTQRHEWLRELFTRFGLDPARFPRPQRFGTPAGPLLPQAAQELGLPEHTLAAVGMQDQKAAALGAGIGPGVMTLSLGTASAVSTLTPRRLADPTLQVPCHAFDGSHWILENTVAAAGASLKWAYHTLFRETSYDAFNTLAQHSPPGANGLCFGPGLDRGEGFFTGLSLRTTQADLARAVMEGVACAVRGCVETQRGISQEAGQARQVRVFGGGAQSPLWLQIMADCLKLPVHLPRTQETANLGAAVCAALAAGWLESPESLARFVGAPQRVFTPRAEAGEIYDKLYGRFRQTRLGVPADASGKE
jgi:xylulokinase